MPWPRASVAVKALPPPRLLYSALAVRPNPRWPRPALSFLESNDRRLRHRHAVRGQAPVLACVREVRRRESLWADRGERLREIDVHEDPGRGAGGERVIGADRIQLKEPGQKPTRAIVA